MKQSPASPTVFEPFGQVVRLPGSSQPPAGARLARVGIYLFWALVAVVVAARTALAFGGHLFAFAS